MRWMALAVLLLVGCATRPLPPPAAAPAAIGTPPPEAAVASVKSQPPHYRCDQGLEFDVRFGDDSAEILLAGRDAEMLLRDAGGISPQHTVYSSTRAKVEFGLDPDGRGAKLNLVIPAVEARCLRS